MTCVTVWLVNITISILEYDSPCFQGAVLYDKVCQFLGDRFLCTQVFSTNKINHLDISEIHVESGVKRIKSNPINPFNLHFMINNINISSKIVPLIFSAFYTVEFIFKTEFSIKGFSHTKKNLSELWLVCLTCWPQIYYLSAVNCCCFMGSSCIGKLLVHCVLFI